MNQYESYNCSVIGFSHIQRGVPCQDASDSVDEGQIHIAVTADGHGDKNCFRSNTGSQAVCEIARKKMLAFAENLQNNGREDEMLLDHKRDRLVTHLFQSILGEWTTCMQQHAEDNPPSEEELGKASESAAQLYRSGKLLTHMYGTTMIAALVTDRYALLIQQGDGRCTVIHKDGTMSQPVPWDPRCEGRNTTSMCDSDVVSSWRYSIVDLQKDPIIGIYCSSDGIEDSFETMEETIAYLGSLTSNYVEEGREHFLSTIGPHFSSLSEFGSLDDVTLSAILDVGKASPFVEYYNLKYKRSVLSTELRKANERLSSMERKTAYLNQQVAEAQEAHRRAVESHKSIIQSLKQLVDRVKITKEQETQQENTVRNAKKRLDLAVKEQQAYSLIRQQVQAKVDEANFKIGLLNQQLNSIALPVDTTLPDDLEEEAVYETNESVDDCPDTQRKTGSNDLLETVADKLTIGDHTDNTVPTASKSEAETCSENTYISEFDLSEVDRPETVDQPNASAAAGG